MKFEEMIEHLKTGLKAHFDVKFDANLSVAWNEEYYLFEVWGHCNKVHPDLVDTYPNGWELSSNLTFDKVLEMLGLELHLRQGDGT